MTSQPVLCHVTAPLWTIGLGADGWLFAARGSVDPTLAIGNIAGPRVTARDATDLRNVGFQLLDAVWLETTAQALLGILISATRMRSYTTERMTWEHQAGWRALLPAGVTLVTGFATTNVESGIELRVRSAADATDTVIAGALRTVRGALVDLVVARGSKRVRTPITDVPPVHSSAYAAVCEGLQLLVLARDQFIAPRPHAEQRAAVALASELARAADGCDVAQLAWLATAHHAQRGGGLARDQRKAALAALRAHTTPDDPIRRLAPAFYRGLGEPGTAAQLAREALAELAAPEADPYRASPADPACEAYRAWLQPMIA
jgi:hypothetical protein